MRSTEIVTSFIKKDNRFLILKRSKNVKTMKELWAAVSGIIEKNEPPLKRAKIEIFEEVGLKEEQIELIKSSEKIRIKSPQYKNHEWVIHPFLFSSDNPNIKLNWENSEYKWILADEISNYETVPELERVLFNLI